MKTNKLSPTTSEELTVVVNRKIKPGSEEHFENSMREFVQFALSYPDHQSIHVLRPARGERNYVVVDKFANATSRESFKSSSEYQEWMKKLGELTEGEAELQELTGLEGWFTLPEQTSLAMPPRLKMAVATYIGVFPTAMLLALVLGPRISSLPFLLSNAIFNACVVILLTWVVMPVVTRLLHRWLFP